MRISLHPRAMDCIDIAVDRTIGHRPAHECFRPGRVRLLGLIAGGRFEPWYLVTVALLAPSIWAGGSAPPLIALILAAVLVTAASPAAADASRHQQRRLYRLFMLTQFGLNAAFAVAPLVP